MIKTQPDIFEEMVDDILQEQFKNSMGNENIKYSFAKGLGKALVSVFLVGLPLVVQVLPQDWLNLTLGGLLILATNYLKILYKNA